MAKTIAALSVSINARTDPLRKGLARARKQVEGFASSLGSAIGNVAKVGAGLTALAAGVAAIGTARQFSALDDLAKTAARLSIDITPLQALRDAAKESGVEVGKLDKGLQKMLRSIQEAAAGRGEAMPTLKDLGLDALELSKMKPEQQFAAVAKAMAAAAGDGQNLARAIKLVGEEGAGLVNTLKLVNEKGLAPFLQQVKESGRGGELLAGRLKHVESVLDALGRMRDRITGIFQQMAVSVAVPLDNLLGRFENFLNSDAVRSKMLGFFERLRDGAENASRFVTDFFNNEGKAAEFRAELGKVFDRFKEFVAWINEKMTAANLKAFFEDITTAVRGTVDAINALVAGIRAVRGMHGKVTDFLSDRLLDADKLMNKTADILRPAHKAIVDHAFSGASPTHGAAAGGRLGSDEEKKQTGILQRQTDILERMSRDRHDRLMVLG